MIIIISYGNIMQINDIIMKQELLVFPDLQVQWDLP
jgi:hypothetical protein